MSGLYLEGADWDTEKGCLVRSKPKALVVELPILKVIPIETRRLRLQVWTTCTTDLYTTLQFIILMVPPNCRVYFRVFCTAEYAADTCVHHVLAEECDGCGVGI